ncbi:MAG: SH3 domain-containing protein [Planctomycetes bacterium]|nr:SH3 domain-containing protein [Planctomycetota bacterium]
MRLSDLSALLALVAGLAAAQSTPLETQPNPPQAGLRGPVDLDEGSSPRLSFAWVASGERASLSGRELSPGTWLFVEPAAGAATSGLAAAVQSTASPQRLGEVDASLLNLRSGPGTSFPVVRRAARHEELVVLRAQGAWLELEDGGRTVWAHGDYVRSVGGFVAGSRSITLRREGERYRAIVREGREVVATQRLRDLKPTVLLVSVEDDQGFPTSLRGLRTYYKDLGYRVNFVVEGDHAGVAKLLEAAADATPYSRVVISTHSGWDGPLWDDGQIAPHGDAFKAFAAALAKGTTPDAKVYVSGCHAGGSNRYEQPDTRIWVRDLARLSGRVVGGPTGSTSAAEHTGRQTLAVLEGVGSVVQETVLATPTTVIRWGAGVERSEVPNEEQPPQAASSYAPIDLDALFLDTISVTAPMPEPFPLTPRELALELEPLQIDPATLELDLSLDAPTLDSLPSPRDLIPGQ